MTAKTVAGVAVLLSAAVSYALPEPVLHYAATDGVTVSDQGVVTGWKNQGSLGSSADLSKASGSGMTLVQNAFKDKPAIRFDATGGSYLTTTGTASDFGLTAQLTARRFLWFQDGIKTMAALRLALPRG